MPDLWDKAIAEAKGDVWDDAIAKGQGGKTDDTPKGTSGFVGRLKENVAGVGQMLFPQALRDNPTMYPTVHNGSTGQAMSPPIDAIPLLGPAYRAVANAVDPSAPSPHATAFADAAKKGEYSKAALSALEGIPMLGGLVERSVGDYNKNDYGAIVADILTLTAPKIIGKAAEVAPGVGAGMKAAATAPAVRGELVTAGAKATGGVALSKLGHPFMGVGMGLSGLKNVGQAMMEGWKAYQVPGQLTKQQGLFDATQAAIDAGEYDPSRLIDRQGNPNIPTFQGPYSRLQGGETPNPSVRGSSYRPPVAFEPQAGPGMSGAPPMEMPPTAAPDPYTGLRPRPSAPLGGSNRPTPRWQDFPRGNPETAPPTPVTAEQVDAMRQVRDRATPLAQGVAVAPIEPSTPPPPSIPRAVEQVAPPTPKLTSEEAMHRYAKDNGVDVDSARKMLEGEGMQVVDRNYLNRAIHGLGKQMGIAPEELHEIVAPKGASFRQMSADQLLEAYEKLSGQQALRGPVARKTLTELNQRLTNRLARKLDDERPD